MNILVTGGAGFIGREVCKQLLAKGHTVRVADNLSKTGQEPEGVEFLNGDLTLQENADKAMEGIDVCLHLAAKVGGVGYMSQKPATILDGSLKLLSAVFEAAKKAGTKRVVVASSSMVFADTDRFPSKESDVGEIPPPKNIYGFSKLVTEYYAKAYSEEFGVNYTIIRPFNCYGVNSYLHQEVGYANVIPDFIRKILAGGTMEMLGDGEQTRCFTHVSDMARGFILAAESEKAVNESFNIGSNHEITMIDLANKIFALSGQEGTLEVKNVQEFKHDVRRRVPDNTKSKDVLGWEPTKDFDEGLKEMITWIRELPVQQV
ncbi:MAG: NAD-dependent epimerase/dehydratase family protein [Candidatus Woesearchaeota archaeon]|jgi:nucleoside-diphosphate-sugar epimerase|nr:NAD-dependent epimerase/dehydratase family protein [Candidatus Woesearchaeota archaeon]MDP7180988.1 NAD-dependent epimerase/dehydratase family protein [Candidatus Woesearchaeota archaeon]MDP7198391.1 NAD-dependent epimerase/dehydratase family protein [Candidatus Woesearchaeota archaeon]MDP7467493.1 NAD-dependent epimerase/dehydratase family protein [Candidatus Woesearchaeota archaeon]MDP7647720.1 NAD-dependent epimerase/dehydratase family protein [Candidatus Woesearchaeota archaeon]